MVLSLLLVIPSLAETSGRTVQATLDVLQDAQGRFALPQIPWGSEVKTAEEVIGVPLGEPYDSLYVSTYTPGAYVHVQGLDEPLDATYNRNMFKLDYADGKLVGVRVLITDESAQTSVAQAYTTALGGDFIAHTQTDTLYDGVARAAGATEEEAYLGDFTTTTTTWLAPGPQDADAQTVTYLSLVQSIYENTTTLRIDIGVADRALFDSGSE